MDTDRILMEKFIDKYPLKAAQVLEGLPDVEVAAFLRQIPTNLALSLLSLMNVYKAAKYVSLLPEDLIKKIMEHCSPSMAESILRQIDEPLRTKMLGMLSPNLAAMLGQKLQQGVNTVGACMVPVLTVNSEAGVKDALETIRKNKEGLESYLYVIDTQGKYEGALRLEDLLSANKSEPIAAFMITTLPKFYPETPINSILDHQGWLEYRSIPVIDKSEKLLGTLPYKSIYEIKAKKSAGLTKDVLETSSALGELYLIGLTGFLQSVGK